MFGKKNYKKIMITILAISMIFGTAALAAEGIFSKKLDATFGRIKFNYEGKDVTADVESKYGTPAFTVDDRAYVPVRALADLLGVEIEYDNKTHTANITDGKVDAKKLEEKDKEIAKLKKELDALKGVKEEKEEKKEEKKEENITSTLAKLKKDVNEKYREYEQVKFDINLSEDKGTVSIQINTDLALASDRNNWVKMRHVDKKFLIEDIVKIVKKELAKYDVKGYIYDSSTRENLYTFNQKDAGTLSIANRDYIDLGGRYDNRDYDRRYDRYIEIEAEDRFDDKYIRDARLDYLDVRGRTADFEIKFTDKYKREWEDLTDSQVRSMLDSVAREIEYEYKDVENIYGDVYMDNTRVIRYEKEYGRLGSVYSRRYSR